MDTPDLARAPGLTRDFTVAIFVVDGPRVLLLFHRKLQMWLPPGGHIETGELPDEAAVREVWEETGIQVDLVGEVGPRIDGGPRPLIRPAGMQLETIRPGHEHIDLIYFARPVPGTSLAPVSCPEGEKTGWYGPAEWTALGVNAEVRAWCARATAEVGTRDPAPRAATGGAPEETLMAQGPERRRG
ncbi:MAG: NUDIX hydrolase [Chloroflexota bacterium]